MMRILLVVSLVIVLCYSLTSGAPIPPPKERKVVCKYPVGMKFRYWNYNMEIYKVDRYGIHFQTVEHKCRGFSGNPMSDKELDKLLRECPQPRPPVN